MEIGFEEYDRALAHYLWPPTWVGEAPYWEETGPQPLPNPALLGEVVTTVELPGDVRARVFRDGMIAFDTTEPRLTVDDADTFIAWHEQVVRLANAHLACLAAVVHQFTAPSAVVTLWSLMQVEFETGKFRASSDHTGGGTRVALHFARQSFADDWRFYRGRGPISAEHMEHSFELVAALLDRPSPDMTLLRAEMLFRARSGLVHRDWSGALTTAWGAMERLLGDLLSRFLDENEDRTAGSDADGNKLKFINGDRRSFFQGREMTARHTVELLSLLDVLPFKLYRASILCAKARNAWLHKQEEPSPKTASMAVEALGELFELVEDVPLRVMSEEAG